jgi:hypothetical protein
MGADVEKGRRTLRGTLENLESSREKLIERIMLFPKMTY